jgi:flagellar basal body-associated protein FliL
MLVILGGTLYALVFRPKAAPPASSPASLAAPEAGISDASIFTGLGRLRCPTADSKAGANPGMVILQAVFPYYPGDRAFSEELVSRIRDFRETSAAYFAALTPEELGNKSDGEIKTELLARYNALLRLGRIETLYFNEYMIIE